LIESKLVNTTRPSLTIAADRNQSCKHVHAEARTCMWAQS